MSRDDLNINTLDKGVRYKEMKVKYVMINIFVSRAKLHSIWLAREEILK